MGNRQTTGLVVNAVVMALARRRPDGEFVHHVDPGTQYTSREVETCLADWGIAPSFSYTGNCFENVAREST